MQDANGSIQRSFRLSRRTIELLDAAAANGDESRNALADRLLGEALRLERHPLVRFHSGASGQRRPLLVGTRHYIHQVISALKSSTDSPEEVASLFEVDVGLIRAAVAYYADFSEEIDAEIERSERLAEQERSRWERQQSALS